jgi:hypothetical protein
MGKAERKWKKNQATKVTKIPKTKIRKYEMKETKPAIFKIQFLYVIFLLFAVNLISLQ